LAFDVCFVRNQLASNPLAVQKPTFIPKTLSNTKTSNKELFKLFCQKPTSAKNQPLPVKVTKLKKANTVKQNNFIY
jgi:hypothetical protein